MSYAVVYSSKTGNTEMLANAIHELLQDQECLYIGQPSEKALKADRVYVGFWTQRGQCCEEIATFLKTLTHQKVFLFGTAGFGQDHEYFQDVLDRSINFISRTTPLVGTYMCQGKMPMSVRERYEHLKEDDPENEKIDGMIENFDKALSHPNNEDIQELKSMVLHELLED